MRFWVHFTDCHRSATGIDQVINHDETFAVAFCAFQHFQLALVVVVIAGDAHGIDMTNTQLACQ
ncbi:hypothetical protein D3C79_984120 [compost metagenome]